jgi:hypothetical protein
MSDFSVLSMAQYGSRNSYFTICNYSGGFDCCKPLPSRSEHDTCNEITIDRHFFLESLKTREVTELIDQLQLGQLFPGGKKYIKTSHPDFKYFLTFKLDADSDCEDGETDFDEVDEGYSSEVYLHIARYNQRPCGAFVFDEIVMLTRDEMNQVLLFLPD